jgi:conjugal transfer pilus assembly protein TraV
MKIIKNCMAMAMITLTLSGCSVYREEFSECGPDKGIPCKTLSEVHQIMNEQQGMNTPMPPVIGEMSGNNVNHEEVVLSDKSVIQRAREEHLRVWIAPFQDDQGNFHEASVVHSVVRPSFWQMQTINWG